jgi:hypothetical protein
VPRARKTSAARRAFSVAALAAALAAAPAHAMTADLTNSQVGTAAGTPVEAVRGGMVIGRGTTSAGGLLSGDGACWANFTPRLRPGDTVRDANGASMVVQDVGLGAPTFDVPSNTTTVPVTAPGLGGLTVTAGGTPATSVTGASSPFTATFAGDQTAAQLSAAYAAADGTTVTNSPVVASGCAAPQDNGVVNIDAAHVVNGVPLINIANVGTPLDLSGPGFGTPTVSIGSRSSVVTTSGGTWTHTFSPVDLDAVADGDPVVSMDGAGFVIHKDTVAPGPPTGTPAPGRYVNGTSVTLSPPEPGAVVHYTTDGSTPTMASPTYSAPIKVATTQTIRAFAVDSAENPGSLVSLTYQVGAAGSGGGGPIPGVTNPPAGGNGGAGNSTTPTPKITSVTVPRRVSLRKLRTGGLVASVELASGTTAVRFTVYRRLTGKRKTLRLVASIVRVPGHPGTYKVKLDARALGLTRTGLYRLKIVPGLSRSTLMQSAAHAIWIRVVK